MDFANWFLHESSLEELYHSAVDAFPNTTRRQHATQPIQITEVQWTPFLGTKSLLARGVAQSDGKEYNCIIMFTGVDYREQANEGTIEIIDNNNTSHFLDQPSISETDVRVRCSCPDFKWRFNYYDHLDNSLYGRKRSPYVAIAGNEPANPMELPGLCKHLMKFMQVLNQSNIIGE